MKKITKLMALSTLLLGGSFAMNAQVVQLHENPLTKGMVNARITNAEEYEVKHVEGGKIYTPKHTRTQAPAEEATITAKINHKYDAEKYVVNNTQIIDFNNGTTYWLYDNDSIAIVPEGVYDIFVCYNESNYIAEDGSISSSVYRYFVREQVELKDGTEIVSSPDDTYNGPIIQAKNPDGEVLRQATIKVNEDGSEEVIDAGNIADMYVVNSIVHKESGKTISLVGGNISSIWVKSTETFNYTESINRINISPLSDRFAIASVRFYYTNKADALYVTYLQGAYEKNGIISNNAEDYVLYEEYIAQSPEGAKTLGHSPFPLIKCGGYDLNGRILTGWQMFLQVPITDNKVKYYVNNMVEGDMYIAPLFNSGFVDGMGVDFIGRPAFDNCYVFGPSAMQDSNGVLTYVNNGDIQYRRSPNDEGTLDWNPAYPGHPLLSYVTTQKEYSLNNCCPIQVPEYVDYMEWYNMFYIYFNKFYGRAGEHNLFNMNLSHIEMTADGELVKEIDNQYYVEWVPSDYENKIVEIISTNENVAVDGIAGKNITTLHIDYTQQNDHTTPMMTMLDFVNSEGIMTDRFATPQDGTIRIFGGDFNVGMTDKGYQYPDCSESLAKVEVYYAPYNTDSWEAITVEEDPDMFYLPGIGQYFSGSLAAVTNVADNGWCDLKIRLTDAAGNYQEQVISPAFYIKDASSINSIENDSDATIVGYYDIMGRKLIEPADGINIVRMSDGTAKKVVVDKK